ncbi:MAG: cation:proton antiporter [Flavobacteriales bacterium]|nr:cation:proton antiporter [Flavobacteriales bacterium]
MDISLVIVVLGLLIFSAYIFNGLFSYTRVPNVLLLLIVGLVVGPLTSWIKPYQFGEMGPVFTSVTLVLILFESGTKLKLDDLAASIGSASLLTLVNFLIGSLIAGFVAYLFMGLSSIGAAFFGTIVSGTSSAIVIPMVNQMGLNKKAGSILLLESAISDVLCLVVGLTLLPAMKAGSFDLSVILGKIWKSFLLALLMGSVTGLAWSVILKWIRTIRNPLFSNLAFAFILYGVTEKLGLNGGMAVLGFGIVLGNAYTLQKSRLSVLIPAQELTENEKGFFSELAFITQTYFFVYVGIHMQFGGPTPYIAALLIIAGILFARPWAVRFLTRGKLPMKDLATMSLMSPKGLVPAILASLPLQRGIAEGRAIQDLAYALILLSIVLCTLFMVLTNRYPKLRDRWFAMLKVKASPEEETEEQSQEVEAVMVENAPAETDTSLPESDQNTEGTSGTTSP